MKEQIYITKRERKNEIEHTKKRKHQNHAPIKSPKSFQKPSEKTSEAPYHIWSDLTTAKIHVHTENFQINIASRPFRMNYTCTARSLKRLDATHIAVSSRRRMWILGKAPPQALLYGGP